MSARVSIRKYALVTAALAVVASAGLGRLSRAADAQQASTASLVAAISTSSAKYMVSFPSQGIIAETKVKPGDVVKAGQELARQDSAVDEQDYRAAQIQAEGAKLDIDAQQKDAEAKEVDYRNKQTAQETNAANGSEVLESKLAFEQAKIKVDANRKLADEREAEAKTKRVHIDKMRIASPADGVVQKMNVEVGELYEPSVKNEGAITIVRNDPLWVELHIPSAQAAKLKVGDKLDVAYGDPTALATDAAQWKQATVIFLDPVVDATVDKQTVRLELPNKENRPAGLAMTVRLPAPDNTAAAQATP